MPGDLPGPTHAGKRDEFIETALNLQGTPYRQGSTKVSDGGLDGPGLVSLCLRRIGLLEDSAPALDGPSIFAKFPFHGGTPEVVPLEILPGDLAWFGKGDHDHDGQQHPMIYLGGDRVIGPVAGGPEGGAVQVVAIDSVPEIFAGWTHLDELGVDTAHTDPHPGEKPAPSEKKLTAALLPSTPADRYHALKALVAKLGGRWDDGKEQINLVGVKNLVDRCLISHQPDDWNDSLFACFIDKDSAKCSLELRASLNPATDSNCAGSWQLEEGSWKFKLVDGEATSGKALQPDGTIEGFFDALGSGGARGGDLMPTDEGDYTKVPIQLGAAPVDAGLARPTKGTQLVWGGFAKASPWGHLIGLIAKSGASVNYTLVHAAGVAQNQAVIHAAIKGTKPLEKSPS